MSISGLLRLETAVNTSDKPNSFNQFGVAANGAPTLRAAGNHLNGYKTAILPPQIETLTGLLGNLKPVLRGPSRRG